MLSARRGGGHSLSLWTFLAVSTCLTLVIANGALVDRVLVIRNAKSPVSRAVSADYMARRGATHVVDIRVPDAAANPDNESLCFSVFQTSVEKPLRAYLATHPGIDFILMTKGVPIVLSGAQRLPMSLDSYVAAMDYDSLPGAIRVVNDNPDYQASDGGPFHGLAWVNRFWNSDKPFSHAAFGGYLVTRLDGYTQADAIALTTRALAAEAAMRKGDAPRGSILLDQDPDLGFGNPHTLPYYVLRDYPAVADTSRPCGESRWGDFNTDMELASHALNRLNIPYILDTTETFLGNRSGLMGYASWGSNDQHFEDQAYATLGFNPGAIAETAVSTSARTFLPTEGGQSLIADLIRNGVTGIKGYVDEPWMQAIASPSFLFCRYTKGWTLAESFYAASNEVGWKDIIIGDPILRAYPSEEISRVDSATTAIARGPFSSLNRTYRGNYRLRMGRDGAFEIGKDGFSPIDMLGRPTQQ